VACFTGTTSPSAETTLVLVVWAAARGGGVGVGESLEALVEGVSQAALVQSIKTRTAKIVMCLTFILSS
jgi:hypothetical protein